MAFYAEILTMTQEMNLEDGSMAHFLVLKLSTGVMVKALVSDESAQAVVYAKVNGTPPPPRSADKMSGDPVVVPAAPVQHSNGFHDVVETDDGPAMIFGGEAPSVRVEPPPVPKSPVRNRIVRVEKDEWGYPIVQSQGGQDPGEVVGGLDPDEDGVSQV